MISASERTGATPVTSREHLVGVLLGLWMVVGLFVDGWAHDNAKPESFFTPWHALLYSGFTAASLHAASIVLRRRAPGRSLREAVPDRHGLTLGSLVLFGIGGVGDLVWHEVLGIEVAIEALLGPTHLLLLLAGVGALSAPIRAAWARSDDAPTLRSFLPTLGALTLIAAVASFFLGYLSIFLNDVGGVAFDPRSIPHEHPSSNVQELQQLLGIASILVTTVVLIAPLRLVLTRWQPPRWTFTIMFGAVMLFLAGMDEFAHPWLILPGVVAGLAADAAAGRLPTWLTGAVATLALWLSYFLLYALTVRAIAWSPELWMGSSLLAALVAAAISAATTRAHTSTPAQQ